MDNTGKRITIPFTGKQTFYKLFKKKICPICSKKMKSVKEYEYKGIQKGDGSIGSDYLSNAPAHTYVLRQFYHCENCNKKFYIGELVGDEDLVFEKGEQIKKDIAFNEQAKKDTTFKNGQPKMKKNVLGIIISTIGVILLGGGIFISVQSLDFEKNAVKGTAVIEDIDRGDTNNGNNQDSNGKSYVKYTIDGKVYHSQLDLYYSGMYIGQKVEIYYDPNNPAHIQSRNGWIAAFGITVLLGSIFSIIGFVMLFVQNKKKNLKQNLTGE
jgi:hypothetical protein